MAQKHIQQSNDSMIGAKQRPAFTLIELLVVAAIFSFSSLLATTVFTNIQSTQRQIQGQQRVSSDGRFIMETMARSVRTSNINYAYYTDSVVTNPGAYLSTVDQSGVITCFKFESNLVWVISPATTACATLSGSAWVSFTPDDLNIDALTFDIRPTADPFRAVPRSATDCKVQTPVMDTSIPPVVIEGFDSSLGACTCTAANVVADCYSNSCTQTSGPKFSCVGGSVPGAACTGLGDVTTCTGGSCTQATPSRLICTNPNVQPQVTIFMKTSSKNTGAGEQASISMQTTVVSRLYQK